LETIGEDALLIDLAIGVVLFPDGAGLAARDLILV
jgi:hypothetical protein